MASAIADLSSPARKKGRPIPDTWEVKNSVRVSNMPFPVMERTVKTFFEKLRSRHHIEEDLKYTIIRIVEFPRDETVFIEFISADIAHRVGCLEGVIYQKALLKLESPLYLDKTFVNNTLGLSFNFQSFVSSTPERKTVRRKLDSNNNVSFARDNANENDIQNLSLEEVPEVMEVPEVPEVPVDADTFVREIIDQEPIQQGIIAEEATEREIIQPEEAADNDFLHTSLNDSNTVNWGLRVFASGLPESFSEDSLEMVLQAYLVKEGAIEGKPKIINQIIKSTPVVIEFVSEAVAKAAWKLKKVHFLAEEVELRAAEAPAEEITSVIASGFRQADTSMEVSFDETLKAHLVKKKLIENGTEVIKGFKYINRSSVVIEFLDGKLATAASSLQSIHFLADIITLKLDVPPKPIEVYAYNITNMDEEVFKMVIDAYAVKHKITIGNEPIIRKIYPKVDGTVKIEVSKENYATFLYKLKTVHYLADVVEFKPKEVEAETEDVDQNSTASQTVTNPRVTSLEGDWATQCFIHQCCQYKLDDKPRSKFFGTHHAFNTIVEALREHNIFVDTAECKRRKKALDEQHRRGPHGTWGPYMAFLRSELSQCPTLFDFEENGGSMEDDVVSAATFTKGAVMSFRAELALIDVWRDNKEEYRKVHKNTPFYRKISAQLILRGHTFSPDQCKLKMDTLRQEFTTYVLRLNKTGQGRPGHWPHYEHLQPMLEDMVNVTAQQTFAVGSSCEETQNARVAPPPPNSNTRYGRERPPAQPSQGAIDKREMLRMVLDSRKQLVDELSKLNSKFDKQD